MDALRVMLTDDQLDALADQMARRLSENLLGKLASPGDAWLDSKQAAAHLGLSVGTVHRLSLTRQIPSSQAAPNCRRFYRLSDLDQWRANGGG